MAKLSQIFPIYDISSKGVIIGDTKASYTACFELTMPVIFSMGDNQFEDMVERFRNFVELLGEELIIHKQDVFHREVFSYNPDIHETEDMKDFIETSYLLHFNERNYLNCRTYLYITKLNTGTLKSFMSKDFAKSDDAIFVKSIESAAEVMKEYIQFRHIDKDELFSTKSPISRYLNFSSADLEEYRDIDFSNNSISVGSTRIQTYSVDDLNQFPTENIAYNQHYQGLPVSNMFSFSYPLDCPHVVNTFIYVPNQKGLTQEMEKRVGDLRGFNVKGSNSAAAEEIELFLTKIKDLGLQGAYYHFNIMCFDDAPENIDKRVNLAFAEAKFKKKENTLGRKDIFMSAIPGNASLLVSQKDNLMSLITDLEASTFMNYEQNFPDDDPEKIKSGYRGVRLCDRLYGIPRLVDIFDEPMKKGLIHNQNALVLSGSGGGKSYTTNLIILNLYRQGAHIFAIDASYSYKLQAAMHNGVYLTFDKNNKISFNPFYSDLLKHPRAKEMLMNQKNLTKDTVLSALHEDYTSKIETLLGLIIIITKNNNEYFDRFYEVVIKLLLESYYQDRCMNSKVDQMCFDDFYNFTTENLKTFLADNDITSKDFNPSTFIMMLKPFTSGQSMGYLLNSEDKKIKNLDKERFIVIDVQKIADNEQLFSIVTTLAMDIYNRKIAKLPIGVRKTLVIDEAWKSIASPEMATFMKAQVKVIRKYGGQTIFISQELDDFLSSEIIRESIVNNSAVKIFADMTVFKQKFEPIKKALSISDNNEMKIKSLNQNNRPNTFYKEICICWDSVGQVYAVETPLELKAIFETNATEVSKILPMYEQYGVELTAINYANR